MIKYFIQIVLAVLSFIAVSCIGREFSLPLDSTTFIVLCILFPILVTFPTVHKIYTYRGKKPLKKEKDPKERSPKLYTKKDLVDACTKGVTQGMKNELYLKELLKDSSKPHKTIRNYAENILN